jgi:hypothetical protein
MIPVIQTKVSVINSKGENVVHGNCLAACIASMLELPITEVPNVEVFYNLPEGDDFYWDVLEKFLASKGWDMCSDDRYKVFHPEVSRAIRSQDERTDEEYRADLRLLLEDNYYFVSGPSPRGLSHITIYKAGELVHDPHPTKEGILALEQFQTLVKINE